MRATESPRPSRRSPASGLLPRAERMGWCARLSIDELGAVGRDDIAALGPVGARLRATECPRPSRRSPASRLLPRAERMVGLHVFRSMSLGLSPPAPVGRRWRTSTHFIRPPMLSRTIGQSTVTSASTACRLKPRCRRCSAPLGVMAWQMALEMILPSSACTLMEKAQMIAANNAGTFDWF